MHQRSFARINCSVIPPTNCSPPLQHHPDHPTLPSNIVKFPVDLSDQLFSPICSITQIILYCPVISLSGRLHSLTGLPPLLPPCSVTPNNQYRPRTPLSARWISPTDLSPLFLPCSITQNILYCLVTYSLVQFEWAAAKFFWFFLFMFLTLFLFTYYGIMAIAITPNVQLAQVISVLFYFLWNLFCGFIIPRPVSVKSR
jgi:hypothetical protein